MDVRSLRLSFQPLRKSRYELALSDFGISGLGWHFSFQTDGASSQPSNPEIPGAVMLPDKHKVGKISSL